MEQNDNLNDYRRELKVKILDMAGKRFRTDGIRNVKMDDIAHNLVISKRTLYELYPTKEILLLACVQRIHEINVRKLQEVISSESTVMDILTAVYRNQLENISNVNPVFYDDLNRYDSVRQFLQDESMKRNEKSKKFFAQGVKQGYFLNNINDELVGDIAQYINEVVIKKRLYFRYPTEEIFRHLMMLFIRGFCTEKGVKEMDKILSIC